MPTHFLDNHLPGVISRIELAEEKAINDGRLSILPERPIHSIEMTVVHKEHSLIYRPLNFIFPFISFTQQVLRSVNNSK